MRPLWFPVLGRGPWPNGDILSKLIGGVTSRGSAQFEPLLDIFHLARMIYQLYGYLLLFCSCKIMISIPNFHMTKHHICWSMDAHCLKMSTFQSYFYFAKCRQLATFPHCVERYYNSKWKKTFLWDRQCRSYLGDEWQIDKLKIIMSSWNVCTFIFLLLLQIEIVVFLFSLKML